MEAVEKAPIFILGCPRSGTTMLRLMLTSHPEICIPHEFPLVQKTLEYFEKHKEKESSRYIDFLESFEHFKDWGINVNDLKNSLDEVTRSPKTYIDSVYKAYAIKMNKPNAYWGDKNIGNTALITEINKLFPNAKFLFIIRDPRDVYSSFKTKKWKLYTFPKNIKFLVNNPVGAAKIWKFCLDKLAYHFEMANSSCKILMYEDLVNEPEITLKETFEFLGLNFNKESLEFHRINQERNLIPKNRRDVYHENTLKPVNNSKIGIYKSTLTSKETSIMNNMLSSYLQKYSFQNDSIEYKDAILMSHFYNISYQMNKYYNGLIQSVKSDIKKILK